LDDHTILAVTDNFGTVSVCPGGVVHVNLPHFTLKFLPSDFLKFSDLVAEARLNFDAPKKSAGKPNLHVVSRDKSDENPKDAGD
jgi:hypothetical protein